MTYTAVSLAECAASAFGLDHDGRTRLHRVFRNLTDKSVIESQPDASDGRGTRRFGEVEAAIALLLLPLARMSVDVRALRQIASALRNADSFTGQRAINAAIDGARSGVAVSLVVQLAGLDRLHTFIKVEGVTPERQATNILDNLKVASGQPLATWSVPANGLLRALVQEP